MEKAELRRLVKARAAQMTSTQRAAEDAAIWASVESLPEFAAASVVLSYMSLPDEVCTLDAVRRWREAGKRVVVPRVVSGTAMELREYCPEKMSAGAFGILEPGEDCPLVDASLIELAIVPGVAFDRSGMRLGRGKGYYDRVLPFLKCLRVGVCHSCRMLDSLPFDSWDVPVDKVITV